MTVSWMGYDFNVHAPDVYWNDLPGVYLFAGRNGAGSWVPVYIGQTNSLSGHTTAESSAGYPSDSRQQSGPAWFLRRCSAYSARQD